MYGFVRSSGVPAMTLLLVDDKPGNLVALRAILGPLGHELICVTSGRQALDVAAREKLSLVLLDVRMPEMDGFEVAHQLKQLERTRDVPVIFLTAHATDAEQIHRAYKAGAADYLVKPLDVEVVRRKVAVFLELVRRREEVEQQAKALREADRREYELGMAELRVASDRRYRKLVEGIDHAIGWTTDDSLRLSFVSRQAPRILGWPMERFHAPDFWTRTVHPDDKDRVLATFRRALADGAEATVDHRMQAADGRILWFHTGVSGEKGGLDSKPELHGMSVDVTELKAAQEEAQRATLVREELLAIVAHDLRSPLTAIQTTAAILDRQAEDAGGHVQESAKRILRSVQRMDRLIADLLDFAHLKAERMSLERKPIACEELVQESLESFLPLAHEKRLQLECHCAGDVNVIGDRDRVLQILSNLVGNAVKFTPEHGSIVIRAERSGNEAVFSVSDSGPGMTDEEMSRIWDRYWQAQKRNKAGVGLGLSIAKGLVERHGGRIWVESTWGAGTTFFFTLPLASTEDARERAAPDH